ncbi:phosphatidylinositol phosphatase PTPRQ-like [Dermacentor andersoni]|uniref:phosphatidylinositol phosphatase PTPRQ-like n=1 Tax=Dermacentor andersoni TaxID=34620 RepID=UPI003B3BE008
MFPESPSRTRIHWDYPDKVSGIMTSYNVKICSTFGSCDRAEGFSDCTEYTTSETWTVFDSREDTAYCVLVTVKTRCGVDELSSRPLIAEIRTPLFGLPDATDLKLLSAFENSVTVAWERPQARFDYYWLSIAGDEGEGRGGAEKERIGSCGNGTIIHPNQTRVTCSNLEACIKVSITLRVHRNGPPESTSPGVSLRGIFIPGEGPDPPKNITMLAISPSLTRLQWEGSAKVYGRFLAYTVKICELFNYCGEEASMHGCIELQAHETWLDFHSSADTNYCVLVTTSSQCGEEVLSGHAAVADIRTPLFVLPDVTDLHLMAVDSHYITLAWDKPRGSFDFYWLDVAIENDNESNSVPKHQAGSCGNGTIIHAEQTRITCGPFDPCSNISVTVRTFVKGPPERISMGSTVKGVFLSGQDPSEPRSINIVAKSPSMTRIQWESPTTIHGTLDMYKVKVCKEFTTCDQQENTGGCIQHSASDAWLEFQSTADTSYCTLVTASARCGTDVLTSPPATLEVTTPLFALIFSDLQDVRKLSLLSAANNSITIAWERPKTRFDYYWVYVTSDESKSGSVHRSRVGSCVNGTIIHSAKTQVTCTNLEACTKVSVSIRTHRSGPSEHTSRGVGLNGVFIPGEDPDPPKGITMVGISPSLTRLQWEPSAKVSGRFLGYMVEICDSFKSCGRETSISNCSKLQTYETWLNFTSRADTKYCVLIAARSQCGKQVLNGRPVVAEIRTPLLVAPDVTNVRLVTVGADFFTAAWEKPKGSFDYYSVEVTDGDHHTSGAEPGLVGSCANGTIIHQDQTQVTCSQLKPCSKVGFNVRTHLNRPFSLTSPGVTLNKILIRDKVLPEVASLTLGGFTRDNFMLTWQRPKECFDYYTVEIIDESSSVNSSMSCNNGSVINENETSVICDLPETCAYVTIRVRTHTSGHLKRSSVGAKLTNVLLRGKVPPDVTNLRLTEQGSDFFSVTFEEPKNCYDVLTYRISNSEFPTRPVKQKRCHRQRSHKLPLTPNTVVLTCPGVVACGRIDFRLWTRLRGPPERNSRGVSVPGIVFVSGCR